MNILVILIIIFWHWLADFVFQSEWEATHKSKSWSALIEHVGTYTTTWLVPVFTYIAIAVPGSALMIFFIPITFICHLITDYYTSRSNKILADEAQVTGKWHDFFVGVGFDQFLHYVQLFLTFKLLS